MNIFSLSIFKMLRFHFLFLSIFLLPLIVSGQIQLGSDIDGNLEYDSLGTSVALNAAGNIMIVGIPHDYPPHNIPGRVRVYEYDGTDWQQLGNDIYGVVNGGGYGLRVSINAIGNIIAISEPVNYPTPNPGNVEVYEFDNNEWVKLGATLSGDEDGDAFGISISLNNDGDILAIGIPSTTDDFTSGSAKVYKYNGTDWEILGDEIVGVVNKDDFGYSIDLNSSGNILVVGAIHGSLNGDNSGYAQVFQFNNNQWEQLGENLLGENNYDWFGNSVSINDTGNMIAVGANWSDSLRGYVSIFELVNNSWTPKGNKIIGEIEGIQLGYNVEMNATGDVLALGLPKYVLTQGSIGKVLAYKFSQNDWLKIGDDIIGENNGDSSGYGLGINSTGAIISIGAIGNDDGARNAGQVRVYDIEEKLRINDNFAKTSNVFIYPNPINNILSIHAEESISSIEIMNLLGQTLITSRGNNTHEQIDISGLIAGNYFVKVFVGDDYRILRVMKR